MKKTVQITTEMQIRVVGGGTVRIVCADRTIAEYNVHEDRLKGPNDTGSSSEAKAAQAIIRSNSEKYALWCKQAYDQSLVKELDVFYVEDCEGVITTTDHTGQEVMSVRESRLHYPVRSTPTRSVGVCKAHTAKLLAAGRQMREDARVTNNALDDFLEGAKGATRDELLPLVEELLRTLQGAA